MDSRSRSRQWQQAMANNNLRRPFMPFVFFYILFAITATLTSYQMTSDIVNHFFGPINFSSDGKSFYKYITVFLFVSLKLSLCFFFGHPSHPSLIPSVVGFFPFSLCPSNINRTNRFEWERMRLKLLKAPIQNDDIAMNTKCKLFLFKRPEVCTHTFLLMVVAWDRYSILEAIASRRRWQQRRRRRWWSSTRVNKKRWILCANNAHKQWNCDWSQNHLEQMESLENYHRDSHIKPIYNASRVKIIKSNELRDANECATKRFNEWMSEWAHVHSISMTMTLSNKWFSAGLIVSTSRTMHNCFWHQCIAVLSLSGSSFNHSLSFPRTHQHRLFKIRREYPTIHTQFYVLKISRHLV